jgi:hypothetical protein
MWPNHHMSIRTREICTCCLSGCDEMQSTHPSAIPYRPNSKGTREELAIPKCTLGRQSVRKDVLDHNAGRANGPADRRIGSAKSLQFSSAIASSLRLSGSDDNQRSQSNGHNNSGMRQRAPTFTENKSQVTNECDIELRLVIACLLPAWDSVSTLTCGSSPI